MIVPGAPVPALLNSTSSLPNFAFAAANSALTERGSETSDGTASALGPISLATALSRSARRPASTT